MEFSSDMQPPIQVVGTYPEVGVWFAGASKAVIPSS